MCFKVLVLWKTLYIYIWGLRYSNGIRYAWAILWWRLKCTWWEERCRWNVEVYLETEWFLMTCVWVPRSRVERVKFSHIRFHGILFFYFIFNLLNYNCFTMLCSFLLYNKVNQLHVYLYSIPLEPPTPRPIPPF